MIVAGRSGGAHSIGWLTSLCLHATLAFGALVVTQRVTLAPQPVPFTWNVAMVTASFRATPVIGHPYDNHPSASQPASITGAISNHCTCTSPARDAGSMRAMTAEPTMPRAAEPMDRRKQAPQVLDSPPPVESTEHERGDRTSPCTGTGAGTDLDLPNCPINSRSRYLI